MFSFYEINSLLLLFLILMIISIVIVVIFCIYIFKQNKKQENIIFKLTSKGKRLRDLMKHGKFKHQIENYEFDKLQDIVIQKMFSLKENYIKGDDTYFMICDIISDLNQMNYNHKTELEK